MAKKQVAKQESGSEIGMGVGVAVAAAAAIAGAYFLYGAKDAKKNRKTISSWMLTAKGEVLGKIEKYKDTLTEEAYYKIVDAVVAKYGSMKDASADEVATLGTELKGHWKHIKGHLSAPTKKAKSPSRSKAKPASHE